MKFWVTLSLLVVLPAVLTTAIPGAPVSAQTEVRVGSGNSGYGSTYEVWRVGQNRTYQLRVWRGTNRSTSSPSCVFNFSSNRDAMAYWREISRLSGCSVQSTPAASTTRPAAPSQTAAPAQRRSTSTAVGTPTTVVTSNDLSCDAQAQEQAALDHLNAFRRNPTAMGRQLGLNLNNVRPQPPLRVNPILSAVARSRSQDLGNRAYFGHVDPDGNGPNIKVMQAGYRLPQHYLGNRSNNFIESLSAGRATGPQAIDSLIIDTGFNPPGHRIHLLAMNTAFQQHTDVGIGFACVPGSPYRYYLTVLTAYQEH